MQIIIIVKIFKDFFACNFVLSANHHYPENIQRIFSCKIVLDANHFHPGNIQRLFPLQNCLRSKSAISWKDPQTFSPAKLSWAQIIIILKTFKDFFACNFVLSANHHYPENIQRIFSCKIVLDANHLYPGNIQRLFPLQNCLRSKSAISWKDPQTFSPAKLSSTQIIIILKKFKNVFARNIVLDANQQYPENFQRIFRLQNCLRRKSSLSWKYSQTFSPAILSWMQIIIILKIFKDVLASKICLRRKSSLSWNYSKIFSPPKLS